VNLKKQAVHGVKWTAVSSVYALVAGLLTNIILARFLAPQDFGLMAMVMLFVNFIAAYTDFGVSAALVYRHDANKEQLSSLYWLNIFVGVLAFLVVWICIPMIICFFKEPRLLPVIRAISFVFIVMSVGKQFEMLLQRDLSFDVLAKQQMIASSIGLILAVILGLYGCGIWILVWVFYSGVVVKTVMLCYIGFKRFRPMMHFKAGDLKGFIGFGMYQMGERTINYLSERLDQILIGYILGASILGLYNFAFTFVNQVIMCINPVITRVAFPVFSKVQHERQKLKSGYLKLLKFLMIVNAPLLVGFAVMAPLLVPLMLGPQWAGSIVLFQVLSLVVLFRSSGNPVGSLLLSKGRADLGFNWNVIFFFASVPALYLGSKTGQALGIGLSLLMLQFIFFLPGYYYLVKPLTGPCLKGYLDSVLRPILIACSVALTLAVISIVIGGLPKVLVVVCEVLAGVLLYMVMLYKFDTKAIKEIKSLIFNIKTAN